MTRVEYTVTIAALVVNSAQLLFFGWRAGFAIGWGGWSGGGLFALEYLVGPLLSALALAAALRRAKRSLRPYTVTNQESGQGD